MIKPIKMKTFLWYDTDYFEYEFLAAHCNTVEEARVLLVEKIKEELKTFRANLVLEGKEPVSCNINEREWWLKEIEQQPPTILNEGECGIYFSW